MALIPPKAPNLPVAPRGYEITFQDRFADILRLYFNQLDHALRQLVSRPFVLNLQPTGTPTASQVLMRTILLVDMTFDADLVDSAFKATTAATAQTDLLLKKNGTTFATVRFAAAGTTATFVSAVLTVCEAGDEITLVAPGSPDATLSGIYGSLLGYL
jgi:hypothetical protein